MTGWNEDNWPVEATTDVTHMDFINQIIGAINEKAEDTGLDSLTPIVLDYTVDGFSVGEPSNPGTGEVWAFTAWTGHDDDVATWDGANWSFESVANGCTIKCGTTIKRLISDTWSKITAFDKIREYQETLESLPGYYFNHVDFGDLDFGKTSLGDLKYTMHTWRTAAGIAHATTTADEIGDFIGVGATGWPEGTKIAVMEGPQDGDGIWEGVTPVPNSLATKHDDSPYWTFETPSEGSILDALHYEWGDPEQQWCFMDGRWRHGYFIGFKRVHGLYSLSALGAFTYEAPVEGDKLLCCPTAGTVYEWEFEDFVTEPPGSPVEYGGYGILAGATGEFEGKDGMMAWIDAGVWHYASPSLARNRLVLQKSTTKYWTPVHNSWALCYTHFVKGCSSNDPVVRNTRGKITWEPETDDVWLVLYNGTGEWGEHAGDLATYDKTTHDWSFASLDVESIIGYDHSGVTFADPTACTVVLRKTESGFLNIHNAEFEFDGSEWLSSFTFGTQISEMIEYGLAETRDYVGTWLWNELRAGLDKLKKFVLTGTWDGVTGKLWYYQNWTNALDWADIKGDVEDGYDADEVGEESLTTWTALGTLEYTVDVPPDYFDQRCGGAQRTTGYAKATGLITTRDKTIDFYVIGEAIAGGMAFLFLPGHGGGATYAMPSVFDLVFDDNDDAIAEDTYTLLETIEVDAEEDEITGIVLFGDADLPFPVWCNDPAVVEDYVWHNAGYTTTVLVVVVPDYAYHE